MLRTLRAFALRCLGAAPQGPDVPEGFALVLLCERCMAGEGGECHTPGCSLWMNRAPDIPVLFATDHTAGRKPDFVLPSAEGCLGYPQDMFSPAPGSGEKGRGE